MHLSMLSPMGRVGGRANHHNLIVSSVLRVGIVIERDPGLKDIWASSLAPGWGFWPTILSRGWGIENVKIFTLCLCNAGCREDVFFFFFVALRGVWTLLLYKDLQNRREHAWSLSTQYLNYPLSTSSDAFSASTYLVSFVAARFGFR